MVVEMRILEICVALDVLLTIGLDMLDPGQWICRFTPTIHYNCPPHNYAFKKAKQKA